MHKNTYLQNALFLAQSQDLVGFFSDLGTLQTSTSENTHRETIHLQRY